MKTNLPIAGKAVKIWVAPTMQVAHARNAKMEGSNENFDSMTENFSGS